MIIKKSQGLYRYITIIFVCLTVMLVLVPHTVSAEDKEYRVNQADFLVTFTENGDTDITELWTVTYENGSFTRFCKDVYNPANQLEYISKLDIYGALINGEEAGLSTSMDRQDGNFYIESASDRYTINWFKAAQNETVTYAIKYRISSAVKLNENDRAEFCYRFIGDNFPKTVGKVNVTFIMPEEDSSAEYTLSSGNFSVSGNEVLCSATDNSGMYKVRLNMDSSAFSGLTRVIDVVIPESVSRSAGGSDNDDLIFAAVLFGIPGLPVLIIIIVLISKYRKTKKLLKENPNYFRDLAAKIGDSGIPFVWYLIKPFRKDSNADLPLYLYAEIFDLCLKGAIQVTPEGLRPDVSFISESDEVQASMDRAFIDMLCKNFPVTSDNFGNIITFRAMSDTISAAKKLPADLNTWKTQYAACVTKSPLYARLVSENRLEELNKDIEFWRKNAFHGKFNVSPYDCFSLLERTGDIDPYTVLMMMHSANRSTPVSSAMNNTDFLFGDMNYFLCETEKTWHDSTVSSSSGGSGCSSCSSCSSCSGCGGGGAD